MCVLAVDWYRKARCCVLRLHCPYWRLEIVVSEPVGEAHLYHRFSQRALVADIIQTYWLPLVCLTVQVIPSCVQETQGTPVSVMLHRTFRCLHFSQATEARERRTDMGVVSSYRWSVMTDNDGRVVPMDTSEKPLPGAEVSLAGTLLGLELVFGCWPSNSCIQHRDWQTVQTTKLLPSGQEEELSLLMDSNQELHPMPSQTLRRIHDRRHGSSG